MKWGPVNLNVRVVAACAALAMGAGACTVESDSSESDTTTADEPAGSETTVDADAPLAASARGVTEDTITLGILTTDVEALSNVGVVVNPGNREAQWQAAIDAVNDAGGINGRQVAAEFVTVDPVGTAGSDAACVKLTEDAEVFMVTGTLIREQSLCYTETNDTAVIMAQPANDEVTDRSKAPIRSYRAATNAQADRVVKGALGAGVFSEGDTIGVIEAQNDDTAFEAMVTAVTDNGLEVVEGPVDTPAQDDVALLAAQGVVLEKFAAEDVDAVAVAGQGLFPLQAADKAGFTAPFALSELVQPARFADEGVKPELSNDVFTVADSLIGTSEQGSIVDGDLAAECLANYEDIDGSEPIEMDPAENLTNLTGVLESCDILTVFAAVAEAAGPNLTNDSFGAALDDLGEIELSLLPFASVTGDKVGISDTAIPVRFDADNSQWTPDGDPVNTAG